jgi:hypothetical protein
MSLRRSVRHGLLWLAVLGLSVAHAAGPPPRVDVTFVDTERYVDAGDGAAEQRQNLGELERQLRRLGSQVTPPGQRLRLEITQVDLAGRLLPFVGGRGAQPTRVLDGGADWPRIDLRWQRVGSDGEVIGRGDASIDDKTYLQRRLPTSGIDRLPYEQRMLAEWFTRTFGASK